MPESLVTLPEDVIEVICRVTFVPEPEAAPSDCSSSSETYSDKSDYGWPDDGDADDGDEEQDQEYDGEESTQEHENDGGDVVEENHEDDKDNQKQPWVPDTGSDLEADSSEDECFNCGGPRNACYREETRYEIDRYRTSVINCYEYVILEKESLCVKDVMNLRLTCRSIAINLIEWFRREFPKCKRAQTGIAEVPMTYRGLQDFNRTIMSEIVAPNITVLHVNVAKFSLHGLRGWCDDCKFIGMCGKLFLEPLDQAGIEAYYKRTGNPTDGLVELEHFKMFEEYVEQEWMMAAHEDVKLLQEAFAHLPNVKEVVIGNRTQQPPPGPGGSTYATLHKLDVQMESGRCANEEAGVWAFQLPQPTLTKLASALAQLKHLHLAISLGSYRHKGPNSLINRNLAPEGFNMEKGLQALLGFLSAAPLLESLNLAAAADNELSIGFVRKVLRALPPTIKATHLHNMQLSVQVLSHFNAHRHSLEQVGLTKAYLTNESWTPVFRMMQLYLPHLQNASFEQLWELHPDFSDKLFFFPPCNYVGAHDGWLGRRYYTVGCANYRGAGRFEDGKWIVDYRYDAMVIRETHKDRRMVQGVQDGLHHAIRWGRREAVKYGSTNVDDPLPKNVLGHVCEAFGKAWEEYGIPEQYPLASV